MTTKTDRLFTVARPVSERGRAGFFLLHTAKIAPNTPISLHKSQHKECTVGLFKKSDLIRISPDDGADEYLINKVVEGANIQITYKDDLTYGKQFVISCPGKVPGASDQTFEMNNDGVVPTNASLVLIDASLRHVTVTLPYASEYLGWLSLVCVNADNGVTLALQDGDTLLDHTNAQLHAPGDALTFASNRKKLWCCVGRYAAEWYA